MKNQKGMTLLAASLAMLLSACGGSSGNSTGDATEEHPTQAGMVLTVGLSEDDAALLAQVEDDIVDRLGRALIPATVRSQRIHCPAGFDEDEHTRVCHDLKVSVPVVVDALRAQRLRMLVDGQQLLRDLEASETFPDVVWSETDALPLSPGVTFVDTSALVWGEQVGLLFALRNGLAWHEPAPALFSKHAVQSLSTTTLATTSPTTTSVASDRAVLDEPLMWRHPRTIQVKNAGYQQRVLAPGYSAGENAGDDTGYWVLDGLSARVGNDKLRCLRARFVDLRDLANTRIVESPQDCGSVTRQVSLDAESTHRVAAGVQMKVSSNDVVGLGLAWGELATEVDVLAPEFLLDTAKSHVKHDGKKDGTFNPDPFKQLNGHWPYVIIGVEARTTDSKVSGLTLHVAELTSTPPAPDGLWPMPQTAWSGYRVDEIEAAVTAAMAEAFGQLADPDTGLYFESFPPPVCAPGSSQMAHIDPCDQFYAMYSESSNETRQECEDGCSLAKGYCDALVLDCETQNLLTPGVSCAHPCEDDVDMCYESCAWPQPSHTAKLNIVSLHGLERMQMTRSSMPFMTQGMVTGMDTLGDLHQGLTAMVVWELCRTSGGQAYCESGMSPLSSQATTVRMRSRLTADGADCTAGARPAVRLDLSLDFGHWGAWDVEAFAEDVAQQAGMSFDWAVETLEELIRVNWQDELVLAGQHISQALSAAMQEQFDVEPLLPCNG
ncbi:hypothetical protein K8B33_04195 [Alcanivorax sp. JB21]|uniref:hypothetical protein n=1 Tax=Alcanivorax limicola TaxID=2874102 RepID=UPI001CBDDB52|nr:hypothetical protein [Alcanivorax limicola]MBZ2188282.1 hypothetical protein [Alcanivorax limicola]